MKNFADSIKKIFSPKGRYRTTAGLSLILVAMLLIVFSIGVLMDLGDWQKAIPQAGDLVTSPAAKNLTPNKQTDTQSQNGSIAENASPIPQENDSAAVNAINGRAEFAATVPERPSTGPDSDRADMIIIPAINISAPLVTPSDTADAIKLKSLLDDGAIIYPDSELFGQIGQAIVLGHSAPAGWPEIKHDTIFSRISELASGDDVIIVYDDKTYIYSVYHSEIIAKGADIPKLENTGSGLVLITCWPPGRDLKRIIVQAALDSVE